MVKKSLNFKEKVERSLALIEEAYKKYGNGLVVANSLGKDSVAVWDLAKKVSPKIRGFIVTTRYKPKATKEFMYHEVARYPELEIFEKRLGRRINTEFVDFKYEPLNFSLQL